MSNDIGRHNPPDAYLPRDTGGTPGVPQPPSPGRQAVSFGRPESRDSLVDILDRVLDKGVVIAGDISINLLDIELLTIKIRLLIASVDKAKEMGIDWWARDPQLTDTSKRSDRRGGGNDRQRLHGKGAGDDTRLADENRQLRERLARLESKIEAMAARQLPEPRTAKRPRRGESAGRR
jgi:hypothetical protein